MFYLFTQVNHNTKQNGCHREKQIKDKDNTNTLLRSSRDSKVHVNTFHIVTCLHLMETFSQALIDVLKF